MTAPDFYAVLGVARDATADDIKQAFRRLAQVHHPDVNGSEDRYKPISEAYWVLSSPERRARYDGGLPPLADDQREAALEYYRQRAEYSAARCAVLDDLYQRAKRAQVAVALSGGGQAKIPVGILAPGLQRDVYAARREDRKAQGELAKFEMHHGPHDSGNSRKRRRIA